MVRINRGIALAACATLLGTSAARAGIADSPLPVLVAGQKTLLLYSVPGVMNDSGTTLGTYFSCTSTSTSPQTVGVELFAPAGGGPVNTVTTTALTVAAGASVTFGTMNTFANIVDADLGAPPMRKGSARILSTSKSLICTVFVADAAPSTPTVAWELTIVAKTKQKAAN